MLGRPVTLFRHHAGQFAEMGLRVISDGLWPWPHGRFMPGCREVSGARLPIRAPGMDRVLPSQRLMRAVGAFRRSPEHFARGLPTRQGRAVVAGRRPHCRTVDRTLGPDCATTRRRCGHRNRHGDACLPGSWPQDGARWRASLAVGLNDSHDELARAAAGPALLTARNHPQLAVVPDNQDPKLMVAPRLVTGALASGTWVG